MRLEAVALALLSAGCARGAVSAAPEPRPRTTVQVRNQNFQDMNVYLLAAGQRIRLGMVTGLSTQVFTLPDHIVRVASQLQFELHPIGGRRNPISETITVMPGDQVVLTIPPS
jgi:hypothetical protein